MNALPKNAARPLRVAQLTPGTGDFHCGSCLRDHALVKALRRSGHDVLMVPLYLPHVADDGDGLQTPVFMGGIGIFLAEKFPWFRRMPPAVSRWLAAPPLLRWAAGMAAMTSAADLGRTTVAMLGCDTPAHGPELDRLTDFLRERLQPDVVHLSNSLLAGIAGTLHERLGARVITSFQGEDNFLDGLPEPYRSEAWRLLGERCRELDGFIAPSTFHAGRMGERLGLAPEQIAIVPNGIEAGEFAPAPAPPDPPAIGYLARMCHAKGLGLLVDAFLALKREAAFSGLKLRVAGAQNSADAPYVRGLVEKLRSAGAEADAEFFPNIGPDAKRAFLRSLSVFSVPAVSPEAFGLYLLEAWATGLPVVAPRSGAFPELIAATEGGLLCGPEDAADLARKLSELLADPARARAMGASGREEVLAKFGVETMAAKIETVFRHATRTIA